MYPFNSRHFDYQCAPMRCAVRGKDEPATPRNSQPFRSLNSWVAMAALRYRAPGHFGLGPPGHFGLELPCPNKFIHRTEALSRNLAGHSEVVAPLIHGLRGIALGQVAPTTWQTEPVGCKSQTLPRYGHLLAEEAPNSLSQPIAWFKQSNCPFGAGSGRNHG